MADDSRSRDELLAALAAARELAARYRSLVDALPDAVTVSDLEGRITDASGQAMQLFDPSGRETLIGRSAFDQIVPEDRAEAAANMALALRHGVVRGLEYRLLRADGTSYVGELSAALVLGSSGEPHGFIASIRDITERKRMEAELQKADKLESLGILAGGIAHDFNNTLAVVVGNASLARRLAPPGSELAQLLADVERGALQGRQLTRQLLTFAKGGAPVKRRLALGQLVRETLGFVLSGSRIRSQVELPDDLWAVEVDEGQLVQVFNNLILNAQQAMPEGGTLEVTGGNELVEAGRRSPMPPGRYVRISVRDHGAGIPEGHRRRIFDPFFTTKPGGTGLGLSTVYSILRRHDGHVTVESEPGRGATFHVWIPACDGPVEPVPARATVSAPRGHGRILVMDDEEQVLAVVGRYLSLCGYEAQLTSNGEQLLLAFRQARREGRPFDAVILDLTVPGGIGGKEALDRLREIDPDVRAVVSSGYSDDPVMAEFRAHGFRGVLVKPYELNELSDLLRGILATPVGPSAER